MSVGKCSKCHQSVFWETDADGKKVALDPVPIRVAFNVEGADGATVRLRPARAVHFDTCKGAAAQPTQRRSAGGRS